MRNICIYHGNCADGFGAAWVVRKALGMETIFVPGTYGNPPPNGLNEDDELYIVDFSYKRPILLELASKVKNLTILDHHKTAQEDLLGFRHRNVNAVFDMERSGATITWDFFFSGLPRPRLLDHIEDRDLWRFLLPGTREIQANVFSYPYSFDVWDKLMKAPPEDLMMEGEAIERKHHKDVKELIQVVTRPMLIGGYVVPVANLPYTFTSDAGHELAKGQPFAGCYWDTPEGRVFSLRSTDEGVDVSEIAKKYGGGGHRNASGFRIGYADLAQFEVAPAAPAYIG
jgi:oligoribonuclease NrnB/cAMP/cGMP phosphodiesterase (DHH superfamily)